MIGTRAMSGSLAISCRKRTIAALLSSMASCVPAILSLQRSGSCGAHKRADRAERHAAHL